jgi:hypothetical protein
MFHETYFNAIVPVVFLIAGSCYLIFRILRKYPDTARNGFDSPGEIRGFYGFALDCIREHKWLVTVPAALVLSYYFIRIPIFIYTRNLIESHGWQFEGPAVAVGVENLLGALAAAGRMLFAGHEVFFLGISPLVLVLVLVILIRPSYLTVRLSLYAGGEDVRDFIFVKKTLSVLHQILLYAGVPLILSIALRQVGIAAYLILAAGGLFRLTVILMLAVITGAIMFFASRRAQGGVPDPRWALRGSLGITRNLFWLYLILYLPLSMDMVLPAVLVFPSSLSSFLGIYPPEPALPLVMVRLFLMAYWKYFAAFITAATAFAPFMLLEGNRGVGAALCANFDFIGRHFVKYLTFIGSGLLLLFLPELLTVLLLAVVPSNSAAELVVLMFTHTAAICLSVVFLLAGLKFCIDYGGMIPHSAPAGGSREE